MKIRKKSFQLPDVGFLLMVLGSLFLMAQWVNYIAAAPTFANPSSTKTLNVGTNNIATFNGIKDYTGSTGSTNNVWTALGNGKAYWGPAQSSGSATNATYATSSGFATNSTTSTYFSGALSGDVSGTQSATIVSKINGIQLSTLSTGLLKNANGTGVPSIAVPGTDYVIPSGNITGTAANITAAVALPNGTSATTQTSGDTSTKLATDQYVANALAGIGSGVTPVIGGMRNLVGSASGSSKTASWSCDEIIAYTSLTGTPVAYAGYLLGTSTLTFNGSGTGAGGMDTGSTPTSGSLYVYAIYRPSVGWSTLGTTTVYSNTPNVYGGSNMPSGYTASALIWSGVTDGSGNIQKFSQQDRYIVLAKQNVLSITASVPTSYTAISLSSIVPANAKTVVGVMGLPGGSSASAFFAVSSDASGTAETATPYLNSPSATLDGFSNSIQFFVPLLTAQTIYYKSYSATNPVRVDVSGYTF